MLGEAVAAYNADEFANAAHPDFRLMPESGPFLRQKDY